LCAKLLLCLPCLPDHLHVATPVAIARKEADIDLAGLAALAIPLHGNRYPMALGIIGAANGEEKLIAFG
jgi:Asp-tRNA(Asn)/Glu-tRNA(Gln) amidotransferase A subunit family amidase